MTIRITKLFFFHRHKYRSSFHKVIVIFIRIQRYIREINYLCIILIICISIFINIIFFVKLNNKILTFNNKIY